MAWSQDRKAKKANTLLFRSDRTRAVKRLKIAPNSKCLTALSVGDWPSHVVWIYASYLKVHVIGARTQCQLL